MLRLAELKGRREEPGSCRMWLSLWILWCVPQFKASCYVGQYLCRLNWWRPGCSIGPHDSTLLQYFLGTHLRLSTCLLLWHGQFLGLGVFLTDITHLWSILRAGRPSELLYCLKFFAFSSSSWKNKKISTICFWISFLPQSSHLYVSQTCLKNDNFMSNKVIHNSFYVLKCIKWS